jgi:hypothetical protein
MKQHMTLVAVRRYYTELWPVCFSRARPANAGANAAESAWTSLAQFAYRRLYLRRRLGEQAALAPVRLFSMAAGFICFCIWAEPSFAQNWTVTTAPSANWVSLASSADGNQLAALTQGGEAVYISTNAGANWTLSSPQNGGVVRASIFCSADGTILYFAGTTQIYCSTNSGASWNPTLSPSASWTSVACSADGTRVAGASAIRRGSPSGIITSPDEGTTWTSTTPPGDGWLAVASSANGSELVGVDASASVIYTSGDGGNSWTQHSPPLQAFTSLASSADGTRLVATSQGTGSGSGPIFISTNSGLNWAQTTAPVTNWVSVASSADGSTIIAASGGSSALGRVYLSTDAGATWHPTNNLLAHWSSVAVSADGSKLVAAENGGHIHTLHLSPVAFSPLLGIRSEGTNTVVSWLVPSMKFTLQQNTDVTSSNWINVTVAPVLNTTDLHNEVTVPSTLGNAYFRLSSTGSGLSGVAIIANILHGPWEALVVNTIFTPTFNADHTFTATIQSPLGVITTDSGTWTLGPTLVPNGFANPQGHLSLTNTSNHVLLSGDALLLNPDQLVFLSAATMLEPISPVVEVVLSKMTP